MIDEKLFQQVSEEIGELRSDMIDFQKSISKIPALSPTSGGTGEWDKVMFIKDYLQGRSITNIEQIDAPDPEAKNGKRPSLIVRFPGKSSERTIWIMSHTDVVPEGDLKKWDSDPWEVIEKDGKLYGRGTEDNQQSLTSSLFTAIAFSKLNIKPTQIEMAEKGIVWIKFSTKGKQCHASTPEAGINAFKAASNLVVKLQKLYDIFNDRDEVFEPPICTFEPTKKDANVPNVNTIPGDDIFYLDCRLLPSYKVDQLLKEIRKICDEVEQEHQVKIDFETTQQEDAAPATPVDSPVVQNLTKAIKAVYQVDAVPMGIGGGTVAAVFRRNGFWAAVWSKIDDTCHQPNEYCVIDNMVNDAIVFAHVCLQK
jgi:succinyl-diaminopimelate desuccinylase